MAGKNYAIENSFVVTKTPNGDWTPGTPNWIKQLASKDMYANEKALINILAWTMSNCSKSGYSFNGGGGSMSATTIKNTADNLKILRKEDGDTCHGSFTNNSSPYDTVNCSCGFEITDAGQSDASGE